MIMQTQMPIVTVIVATLAEDAAFYKTLESVSSQSDISVEFVGFIFDEKYDLANPDIKLQNLRGKQITLLRGKDGGIADAWNAAISYAQGTYLCFLGAGDYFCSADSLAALLSSHSEMNVLSNSCLVFYGNQFIQLADQKISPWLQQGDPNEKGLNRGMIIPHASSLWPRVLWNSESFDRTFRIALDYEFALRVSRQVQFVYVDCPAAIIQPGGISNAPSHMLRVVKEDIRARLKNGFSARIFSVVNAKRIIRWLLMR